MWLVFDQTESASWSFPRFLHLKKRFSIVLKFRKNLKEDKFNGRIENWCKDCSKKFNGFVVKNRLPTQIKREYNTVSKAVSRKNNKCRPLFGKNLFDNQEIAKRYWFCWFQKTQSSEQFEDWDETDESLYFEQNQDCFVIFNDMLDFT